MVLEPIVLPLLDLNFLFPRGLVDRFSIVRTMHVDKCIRKITKNTASMGLRRTSGIERRLPAYSVKDSPEASPIIKGRISVRFPKRWSRKTGLR